MKTFYTDGTGSQQTLNDSQTEKVIVYDTINDAEADLANLAEGQIIATKDDDFEGNAVPVNEVAVNNMHSVTSNAVYGALNTIESYTAITGLVLRKLGRIVLGVYARYLTSSNPFTVGNLPQDWRPQSNTQVALINSSNDTIVGQAVVYSSDGKIMLWNGVEGSFGGSQYAFSICYFV